MHESVIQDKMVAIKKRLSRENNGYTDTFYKQVYNKQWKIKILYPKKSTLISVWNVQQPPADQT